MFREKSKQVLISDVGCLFSSLGQLQVYGIIDSCVLKVKRVRSRKVCLENPKTTND